MENSVETFTEVGSEPVAGAPSASEVRTRPPCLPFEPVEVARRCDGWYPERQRAFIEELADCGVVREAAARVGMTERSARNLRLRPDAAAFSLAWDAAVRAAADRLRSIAFDRAVNGTVRERWFKGEVVGEERVFDNRLLIYLLGRLDHPRRDREPEYRVAQWHAWLEAVEEGSAGPLPAPDESHRSPVWRDEDGQWLTSFPPPEGFDGEQWGSHGEEEYCRALSPEEEAAIAIWEARPDDRDSRRRDHYFRRLAEVPHPR